jgi:hypothetical protein
MRQERGYWSLERGWGWVFSEDYCGFSCKVFRLPEPPAPYRSDGGRRRTVRGAKSLKSLSFFLLNYGTYSAYGTLYIPSLKSMQQAKFPCSSISLLIQL